MREIVDTWINDYSRMIEDDERQQLEHEEQCELVKHELMQLSKLLEFYAERFDLPLTRSQDQINEGHKLIDNINLDLRRFRESFDE